MQEERYGTRDRSYSAWHRRNSTRRFIGLEKAQSLAMIDLDCALYVEYDDATKEPLALIETAQDVGQRFKSATVTTRLAQLAGIPAYVLLYKLGDKLNPADMQWRDIVQFRIRRMWPKPEAAWRLVTPDQWAKALLRIRAWATGRLDEQAANDAQYEHKPEQGRLFSQ